MLNVIAKLKNSYTMNQLSLKKSNSGSKEDKESDLIANGRNKIQRRNTIDIK
jgi:hypothetical protein